MNGRVLFGPTENKGQERPLLKPTAEISQANMEGLVLQESGCE